MIKGNNIVFKYNEYFRFESLYSASDFSHTRIHTVQPKIVENMIYFLKRPKQAMYCMLFYISTLNNGI